MKKSVKRVSAMALAVMLGVGSALGTGVNCAQPSVVYAADSQTDAQSTTVVNTSTTWKYLDNNTDPADGLSSLTAWTLAGFDDSSWSSAAGKFGAKRGELNAVGECMPTVLLNQYRPEDDANYAAGYEDIPTFFFRTTFNVENIGEITSVTGSLLHDDAVAVYLNGKELVSTDMEEANRGTAGYGTTETNMFYAGVSAGDPKTTTISLTEEEVQSYLTEGANVLAVELHNDRGTSSDIYLEFAELTLNYNQVEPETEQKSVVLTIGSNENSRNLTWYTNSSAAGKVQVAKANGSDTFPETYKEFEATSSSANDTGYYTNQTTITGLEANTSYVYRLVNGDTTSKTYTFKTGSASGSEFSFAFVGDPQIGAGKAGVTVNTEKWGETLNVIAGQLQPEFLLSGGDQVNTANRETEYTGYINDILSSLTSATTIGNHDSGSTAYNEHFNLPNESADLGVTTAGSNYWFVYKNTLFIGINSNNQSAAEHKAFIESAIKQNPDVTWKTVFFHHSIYSSATHWDDNDIISRRSQLPQIFEECDIDVVLMGHDHIYTRSYMLETSNFDEESFPKTNEGVQSETYNPTGILYLTASSASGSKYYEQQDTALAKGYAAVSVQNNKRTITDVTVTENSYTLTTYELDDSANKTQIDTFTIYKTDKTGLKTAIDTAKELKEADYTAESWKAFKETSALEEAITVYETEKVKQDEINAKTEALESAMDLLVKAEDENNDQNNDQNNNQNNDQNGDQNNSQNNNSQNNGSGTGSSKPDAGRGPKTGDTTNAASVGLIMLAAAGVIVVVMKKRKEAEV